MEINKGFESTEDKTMEANGDCLLSTFIGSFERHSDHCIKTKGIEKDQRNTSYNKIKSFEGIH